MTNNKSETQLRHIFYKEFARVTLQLRIGLNIRWVSKDELYFIEDSVLQIPNPIDVTTLFACFNILARVVKKHHAGMIPLVCEVEANEYANSHLFNNGIMPFENNGTLMTIALYKKMGLMVEGITDQYNYVEKGEMFELRDNKTGIITMNNIDMLGQFSRFLPPSLMQYASLHYHLN
jgi:hypothetical protein